MLGFALVAVPVQLSLLFEEHYGYGAFRRGWIISLGWVASLAAIPIAGRIYDRIFRVNPAGMLRTAGIFIMLGAQLLDSFHWIIYIFGGFLILTAIKMLLMKEHGGDPDQNAVVQRTKCHDDDLSHS